MSGSGRWPAGGLSPTQRMQMVATLVAPFRPDAEAIVRAFETVEEIERQALKRCGEEPDQSNDTGFTLPEPFPFRVVMG